MDAHVAPSPGGLACLPAVRLRVAGDERLAKLAGAGSEAAFAVLFQRFHQPLYRYCRSLLGNDADAQDALQTTFTQALVALREDRRTAPVRPWLYRIAHNESVSLLRRRRPAQELPADGLSSSERSAHEAMEERARFATLVADLRDLPERQRGALVMRELSGLPHEEIALAFGISVGAAKQTVLEARRSLQEYAEGRALSCDEIQRIVSDGDGRALRARRVRAHLRDCAACHAFATAIPARRAELRALSPALPVATAAGLLARLTGAGSSQGGGGAGVAAAATSKAMGLVASAKVAATAAAVVAAAAVGAGEIRHLVTRPGPEVRAPAAARAGAPAPHPTAARRRLVHAPHAQVRRPAMPTARAASRPEGSHRRHPARRHHATGTAATGTSAAAVVTSPGASGTRGQGAVHRAAAATSAHAAVGSRGASASAPSHTGHTGRSAAPAAPARGTSHGHASSAGRRAHGRSAAVSHSNSQAASAGNGNSGPRNSAQAHAAQGNAAAGGAQTTATATTPADSGH